MRNLAKLTIYILLLFLAVGCNESDLRIESTGRNYEVYVVTSGERWRGALGDTLRHYLAADVEVLNQQEPRLSMYYIEPSAYNTVISRHKNLMLIEINEKYKRAAINATYDLNASPQIVVSLVAPTIDSLINYVSTNGEELARVFEIAEKDRFVSYALKYGSENIEQVIKDKFDFEMAIPQGYKIRTQKDNFMWISYEKRFVSQGLVIYSYPYTGPQDFTEENLIARRNEFVKNIPGPSDGSYMTTTSVVPPTTSYIKIDDKPWAETMGFWDVENDYMGGPFRSYSTLNTKTNMVVCIDVYLYSPKEDKRNYIRELENLIYTVKVE
ncbi:MAG: DUF4837 family protein [Rikenellaceae bacterium]